MAFHEVRFPTDISYGSRGGPRYATKVIELDSGAEERVQRWSSPKFVYDVDYGVKTLSQLRTVYNFFLMRQGATYGFRYKDFLDYTSASDNTGTPDDEDQSIGTGDGTTKTFQLTKTYTDGTYQWTRTILKPVTATVVVAVSGAAQTENTHFTVDYTTGIITFATAPSSSAPITAGFEFDVPVRFGSDVDADGLIQSIDFFDGGSIPSIRLVEDKDSQPVANAFFYGGAKDHGTTAGTIILGANDPRVHTFAPASALELRLPEISNFAFGGPHFVLFNSGAGTITVRDYDDAVTVDTLVGSGTSLEVFVGIDSSGNREWWSR